LLLASPLALRAAAPDPTSAPDKAIPEPLRPWIGWVLRGDDERAVRCPGLDGKDDRVCAWPARLALTLDDRGGKFEQHWEVFTSGPVLLPGEKEHWPQEVTVDGRPAPMTSREDRPAILLGPGVHQIAGRFGWDSLPESLQVPIETGLLALSVNGKRIDLPARDGEGRVFLGRKAAEKAEADSVDVSVHRKLIDDVPLILVTRLTLAVAGRSRELLLGRALPQDFEPMAVESSLPVRIEPDGKVRVQVRPGNWPIELRGRRTRLEKGVTRPDPGGLWKEGEEAWVFEARPELRVVTVEGVPAIDPAQTTLPAEWRSLPAYAVAPGATMVLSEQHRGDAQPAPDRLALARTYWLDFDGGGYSVNDVITGQLSRSWRLEMGKGTQLGRVSADGAGQFITRVGEGLEGVELRSGKANLDADSRIEGRRWAIPATSFDQTFDRVSATLRIPAGWRLLHVSGVDGASGTWIERWSLLDFFLLLLIAVAVGRLYGPKSGAIALAALGLSLVEPGAPRVLWLLVLVCEALVRVLEAGRLAAVARLARSAAWLALAIVTIPFAVREIRQGIHPAAVPPGAGEFAIEALTLGGAAAPPISMAAPAAPAQEMEARPLPESEAAADNADQKAVAPKQPTVKSKRGVGKGSWGSAQSYAQNRQEYDPTAVIQTGPGLPSWRWSEASFSFNGPVPKGQSVHLYFVPPWLEAILAFVRVGLLALLAWILLRRPLHLGKIWANRKPLLAGLFGVTLLALPQPARSAEFPPDELLEALKERLLEKPACAPRCASINDLALDVSPEALRLRLRVSAAARTAIPLPGDATSWAPAEVRVDGKPATALSRSGDGALWLALPAGAFTVELSGPIPSRDAIQIPLPLPPHHATSQARGFRVDGIHEDGMADRSLLLTRETRSSGKPGADGVGAGPALPPFLRVERTLRLGLKWTVQTRVVRQTPAGSPIGLDVPLLEGESVTTPGIRIDGARHLASLSFAPAETELAWESTLAERPELVLRADPAHAIRWVEQWRVEVGPTWHATFSGIPPTHRTGAEGDRTPQWAPWPGEEVRVALTKPKGVPGQTLTIDSSHLEVSPGPHGSRMTLVLGIRASRGMQHKIGLPAEAEVESVKADGTQVPIRQDGQALVLDVPPGKRTFTVAWRQPVSLAALFRVPSVDLGLPSTNSEVQVDLSDAPRWLLWTRGPGLGPGVHFWSVLVVLLLLGWGLARTGLTPLRVYDWILLGLGLLQLEPAAALILPVFLLALGWRARTAPSARGWVYDLGQLVLAGLLVLSVSMLIVAVEQGLLQHPDMGVAGNGSSSSTLRWYLDRSGAALPQPWFVSLPMLVYRLAMLAWALWLASAGVRWARWIWECLSRHGLWRPWRTKAAEPAARP
jgi:hypothetical protein